MVHNLGLWSYLSLWYHNLGLWGMILVYGTIIYNYGIIVQTAFHRDLQLAIQEALIAEMSTKKTILHNFTPLLTHS